MFRFIEYLHVKRLRQVGLWHVSTVVGVAGSEQFTDELLSLDFQSRWFLVAIHKAIVGTWLFKRRMERDARPQRALNGWN